MGARLKVHERSCQHSRRIFHGFCFLKDMLQRLWQGIRQLSGDDAYERYLAHHAACHADTPCLSRREFFLRYEQQKWGGIKRCC